MTILKALELIPDWRVRGRCLYPLPTILGIALVAVLRGCTSYRQIAHFARTQAGWLRACFFPDLGKTPSHDVFRSVFVQMDPDLFCGVFALWAQGLRQPAAGEHICLDGKALRGAARPDGTIPHVVSAWSELGSVVVGQIQTDAKSNEIAALPELIRRLVLRDCIVTIDAAGCQKGIARIVVEEKGGDYVLALKGNQGTLFEEVRLLMEDLARSGSEKLLRSEQTDKGHGRVEVRRCFVTHWVDWQEDGDRWAGLKSLCMVESERTVQGKGTTVERRFYISSLQADAEAMGRLIRGHWGIENRLHYVKDVDFGEDGCRARSGHSAMNRSTLLHVALNLINRARPEDIGVKAFRQQLSWDPGLSAEVVCA